MSEPKLTPWFDGRVKPMLAGVYEVQPGHGRRFFSYWTGRYWMFHAHSVERAFMFRDQLSSYDVSMWRGLAEPPKGGAA